MTKSTRTVSEKDNISAAEYALGVMQGKARADFAKRVADEPALAAAVRVWDENFVSFTDDIAPVKPPSHIDSALQQRLFPAQQKSSFWNSLGLWRGLAIASLAGLLAIGAWTLRPQPEGPAMVAQVAAQQGNFKLVAYFDSKTGELRLNHTEGAAVTGRAHELWLIAGTDAPVSLGVLTEASTSRVIIPAALRPKFNNGILAVSDEPAGGSTTGAPTGAVLATGALTEV